jgi:sec-independent protein translocase protein TatA
MPFNMGPGEILLIFLLIIILFGAKRLPELARSLGKSIKEFKHATQGLRDELDINKIDEKEKPRQQTVQPKTAEEPEAKTEEADKKDSSK